VTLAMTNSTVSQNTGGGMYLDGLYYDSSNELKNSIVYGNAGFDVNLVSGTVDYTDCIVGDRGDPDPLLGPLQDNGGPTFTHALPPAARL
jgi:hypothetical protein